MRLMASCYFLSDIREILIERTGENFQGRRKAETEEYKGRKYAEEMEYAS